MNLPGFIAFLILYARINGYRDFGGNEQNKRAMRAAYKLGNAKNKHTKRSRDPEK